ncbi:MAG: hypothetical protein IPG83_18070 [Novosphingobium sp.]|jgi:hypothetical protein|nr:hypothetical protein [Novosphingobium sp.]
MTKHHDLVGVYWPLFERALASAGATGDNSAKKISSLRGRLGPEAIRQMHYLRTQRNRLVHAPALPLKDANHWETLCRASIRQLAPGLNLPAEHIATDMAAQNSAAGEESSTPWILWGVAAFVALGHEPLQQPVAVLFGLWLAYRLYSADSKR